MKQEERQVVLTMEGITKRFPGVVANDSVDLKLHKGEVLALLGENGAGKSSLMNVLAGLYRADEGEIFVHGERAVIRSPQDSMRLGMGMIHQEFMLVQTMTVAENIILGLKDLPFIPPMQEVRREVKKISQRYSLQVDPDTYIYELGVGQQQRVEILKLVYRGAEILILDEPTAVLTPQESRELNGILKLMLQEGKSAIFITHKMDEVLTFSHRVQVLRQGKTASVCPTAGTTPRELASMMVGREVLFRLEKQPAEPGAKKLVLKDVTVCDRSGRRLLDGIDLDVREGEILGIAGVAGNGQQELAETVTGLLPVTSGEIYIGSKRMTNRKPIEMIRAGMSHIPADRGAMGIVGDMSVADNLAMKRYRNRPMTDSAGILHLKKIIAFARKMIESFRISTPTPETMVKFLSGGNIQKTILAREIDSCGGVLVAVYPSRGLDVGAIEAVRKNILQQRERGAAVMLVSEELDELLSVADRIAVMHAGAIMGIRPAEAVTKEELGLMMAGISGGDA